MKNDDSIIVAVTGASGSVYAKKLVSVLLEKGFKIKLIFSDAAKKVIAHELGEDISSHFSVDSDNVTLYSNDDIAASISSGSSLSARMIIIPASMGTTARVASGISSCLIERAADVIIKESGKLVLVPREAPFSPIHLENMLKLSKTGVTVIPAAPAFYHKPESIDDLIDFIIVKVLDALKIENDLIKRWE